MSRELDTEEGFYEGLSDIDIKTLFTASFGSVKTEFMKVPFEIRLTVFPVDTLIKVQDAYVTWDGFVSGSMQIIKEYDNKNLKSLKKAVEKLDNTAIKGIFDDALNSMKELLPKNFVE